MQASGYYDKIKEVITDHGSQFFANKSDKNVEPECALGQFLAENEIEHILARVNHPQTNGKIEKWLPENRNSGSYLLSLNPILI
jgi:transposase InsO family protein